MRPRKNRAISILEAMDRAPVAYQRDTIATKIAEAERLRCHIERKERALREGKENPFTLVDLIGRSRMKRAIVLDEIAAMQQRAIARERRGPKVPLTKGGTLVV